MIYIFLNISSLMSFSGYRCDYKQNKNFEQFYF